MKKYILSEHFQQSRVSSKHYSLARNGNPPDAVKTHVPLVHLINVPPVYQATPFPGYGRKLHSEHLRHEMPIRWRQADDPACSTRQTNQQVARCGRY